MPPLPGQSRSLLQFNQIKQVKACLHETGRATQLEIERLKFGRMGCTKGK
jgi:hypothetical protein